MASGERQTKIVATVGPATASAEALRGLIGAGVDVLRLNSSHGTQAEKAAQIETIRRVAMEAGRQVAILQDLQGPKIRVGRLPGGAAQLREGETVRLTGGEASAGAIPVSYAAFGEDLVRDDVIFLDDGSMQLRVESIRSNVVRATVIEGGRLLEGKGVNLPGVNLKTPAVTEKDEADLRFGLEAGVDFVALSFVRRPQDSEPARRIMREAGRVVPLIAKIEKREAVASIDGILRAFDGVMVARGDLGVEMAPERVPTAQKLIIDKANAMAKPVITATQMLESMTHSPKPTRAEASDVANAVTDGSDAVMLSGETAIGEYPLEAVRMMDRIAREAEQRIAPRLHLDGVRRSTPRAFCIAAVQLAEEIGAAGLAALTRSGRTAQTLSSLRPSMPIFALCEDDASARRLCLWHGVVPLVMGSTPALEEAWQTMRREVGATGLVSAGSRVVLLGAAPGSRRGRTDFIRLVTV
ncbi:MAG TPA: pyruvate kinase [Dehalococcoidia bacterium]|nr:pyruvate kinase [Dehalococcoidia bacterium]